MRAMVALVLAAVLGACSDGSAPAFESTCEPTPPGDEALLPAGPHPDGGYILIGGRRITPAGEQVPLGGFPMSLLQLDDRYVAISDGARDDEAVRIFDVTTRTVTDSDVLTRDEGAFFVGLAYGGGKLWASGGGGREGNSGPSAVYVYDFDAQNGLLGPRRAVPLGNYPAGAALTADGATLVVAEHRGNAVAFIDTATETVTGTLKFALSKFSFPIGVATSPVASGRNEAYVTFFGDTQVAIIDLDTEETDYIEVGKNPEGLMVVPPGDRLVVAASDSDSVSVIDLATRTVTDTVELGETVGAPRGLAPSAVSLTPDGARLLVALAGENAIDVLDTATLARVGRIPTGWYPTAALWHPVTGEVLILNAKGVGAGPNVKGTGPDWLSGISLMQGTLSVVPGPDDDALAEGATTVTDNNARPQAMAPTLTCSGEQHRFPLPEQAGDPTPIEHVVLIVRENKTYDAVLGDLEGTNGEPGLALWGEEVTPNLHALARQFAVLDNFYSNAEQSLQGHQWTAADNSNDFSEKAWLTTWGRSTHPISDFATFATMPEQGYVWQQLARAGVSYVDFGEIIGTDPDTTIDVGFPGLVYNLDVLDVDKAAYVADQIETVGLPQFTYLLLPNDHTNGTAPGKPTPESMIADNDEATGRVVDALSHSPLWERSVVFIIEDDPQDGADHVEAHRSPCVVAGPWVRHGHVSSVHYDNPSLWRTITLLLGVAPLSRFDATAAAMYDVFASKAAPDPYTFIPRHVPVATNSIDTVGAEESLRMDFSVPDQARGLAEVLWRYRMGTEPPWVPLGADEDD